MKYTIHLSQPVELVEYSNEIYNTFI